MDLSILVDLFGIRAQIIVADAAARERLLVVYAALLAPADAGSPAVRAELVSGDGGFGVRVTDRPPASGLDLVSAIRALNHELLHAAMARARKFFFIHAGVVAIGARALVLPGLSRAGKSTLVLALLERGATFFSDEIAAFDPVAREVRAFPRAPKLREVCVPYFPRLKGRTVGEGEGRFVRPATLGLGGDPGGAAVRGVVLPGYDGGVADRLDPATRGEALLGVTSSALNFGAHGPESLGYLTTLCSEARVARLSWRDPHAAAALVLEWFSRRVS